MRLMRRGPFRRSSRLAALLLGGMVFGMGCDAAIQREMEVLLRPEANPLLIRQSFLVNALGPEIFGLFR